MTTRSLLSSPVMMLTLSAMLAACGPRGSHHDRISIDGSSTVYPITEAIAEEFRIEQPAIKITIGVSGTGGGFNKFMRGEIAINNASRPIKEREAAIAAENNIRFIELKVAYDGLAVAVNNENTWLQHISVEELKKIWEPAAQDKITYWNQVNPAWPAEEFHLYGPGIASGTYDYFTEAIVGESGASRGDYTASEDDNVLVQGIAGDKNGLGFFGLAYYEENKDKLRLIGVENADGVVMPDAETIKDGTYTPLSRPVFIYVSDVAAQRADVRTFIDFYLKNAATLVPDVGYVPMTEAAYAEEQSRFRHFVSGVE